MGPEPDPDVMVGADPLEPDRATMEMMGRSTLEFAAGFIESRSSGSRIPSRRGGLGAR